MHSVASAPYYPLETASVPSSIAAPREDGRTKSATAATASMTAKSVPPDSGLTSSRSEHTLDGLQPAAFAPSAVSPSQIGSSTDAATHSVPATQHALNHSSCTYSSTSVSPAASASWTAQVPYLSHLSFTSPTLIYQPPTVVQLRNAGAVLVDNLVKLYSELPRIALTVECGSPYARHHCDSVEVDLSDVAVFDRLRVPPPIDWDSRARQAVRRAQRAFNSADEETHEEAFLDRIRQAREVTKKKREQARRRKRQRAMVDSVRRASVTALRPSQVAGTSEDFRRSHSRTSESMMMTSMLSNSPFDRECVSSSAPAAAAAAVPGHGTCADEHSISPGSSAYNKHLAVQAMISSVLSKNTSSSACASTTADAASVKDETIKSAAQGAAEAGYLTNATLTAATAAVTPKADAQRTAKGLLRQARFNANQSNSRVLRSLISPVSGCALSPSMPTTTALHLATPHLRYASATNINMNNSVTSSSIYNTSSNNYYNTNNNRRMSVMSNSISVVGGLDACGFRFPDLSSTTSEVSVLTDANHSVDGNSIASTPMMNDLAMSSHFRSSSFSSTLNSTHLRHSSLMSAVPVSGFPRTNAHVVPGSAAPMVMTPNIWTHMVDKVGQYYDDLDSSSELPHSNGNAHGRGHYAENSNDNNNNNKAEEDKNGVGEDGDDENVCHRGHRYARTAADDWIDGRAEGENSSTGVSEFEVNTPQLSHIVTVPHSTTTEHQPRQRQRRQALQNDEENPLLVFVPPLPSTCTKKSRGTDNSANDSSAISFSLSKRSLTARDSSGEGHATAAARTGRDRGIELADDRGRAVVALEKRQQKDPSVGESDKGNSNNNNSARNYHKENANCSSRNASSNRHAQTRQCPLSHAASAASSNPVLYYATDSAAEHTAATSSFGQRGDVCNVQDQNASCGMPNHDNTMTERALMKDGTVMYAAPLPARPGSASHANLHEKNATIPRSGTSVSATDVGICTEEIECPPSGALCSTRRGSAAGVAKVVHASMAAYSNNVNNDMYNSKNDDDYNVTSNSRDSVAQDEHTLPPSLKCRKNCTSAGSLLETKNAHEPTTARGAAATGMTRASGRRRGGQGGRGRGGGGADGHEDDVPASRQLGGETGGVCHHKEFWQDCESSVCTTGRRSHRRSDSNNVFSNTNTSHNNTNSQSDSNYNSSANYHFCGNNSNYNHAMHNKFARADPRRAFLAAPPHNVPAPLPTDRVNGIFARTTRTTYALQQPDGSTHSDTIATHNTPPQPAPSSTPLTTHNSFTVTYTRQPSQIHVATLPLTPILMLTPLLPALRLPTPTSSTSTVGPNAPPEQQRERSIAGPAQVAVTARWMPEKDASAHSLSGLPVPCPCNSNGISISNAHETRKAMTDPTTSNILPMVQPHAFLPLHSSAIPVTSATRGAALVERDAIVHAETVVSAAAAVAAATTPCVTQENATQLQPACLTHTPNLTNSMPPAASQDENSVYLRHSELVKPVEKEEEASLTDCVHKAGVSQVFEAHDCATEVNSHSTARCGIYSAAASGSSRGQVQQCADAHDSLTNASLRRDVGNAGGAEHATAAAAEALVTQVAVAPPFRKKKAKGAKCCAVM